MPPMVLSDEKPRCYICRLESGACTCKRCLVCFTTNPVMAHCPRCDKCLTCCTCYETLEQAATHCPEERYQDNT